MRTLKIIILAFAALFAAQIAAAKDIKFELNLNRDRIAIGEKAQLGLSFYGTQAMPAPDIGNIDGLEVRYVGPSTMMTVINGQVSSSVTHMYTVLPLKTGKFQLGPFSFKHKGDSYSSNIVFLEVVEEAAAPAAGRTSASQTPENMDLEDRIFLTLNVGKPAAYVNELIPIKVKLYVNRLNVSDIQLPTFEQEGFSKVEFKEPKQYRENINGLSYDVLEFDTNIFGTRPGDYRLGPAKIKSNVVAKKRVARARSPRDDFFGDDQFNDSFFDDFFTRYERFPIELKSQEVQVVISPLPAAGRPQDFSGAVGDYQFIYRAGPTKLKVGDPITVRMDINGTGNFNTVLMPKMEDASGFKVYEPQVNTQEHTKSFTQVLIPENELVTQMPRASFSYFDPDKREYKQIAQNPISIQVEKGKEEAPSQIVGSMPGATDTLQTKAAEEGLARDIIYIKESPGRWLQENYAIYRSRYFLPILIMPLGLLIALSIIQARRNKFKRDTVYAGRRLAIKYSSAGMKHLKAIIKSDDQKAFYQALFETIQNYLGNRLHIPPHGVTYNVIENVLLTKEIDADIMNKIKKLFEACDRARFAFTLSDGQKMKDDIRDLENLIKYFERARI